LERKLGNGDADAETGRQDEQGETREAVNGFQVMEDVLDHDCRAETGVVLSGICQKHV
jgi:hypothetical protein